MPDYKGLQVLKHSLLGHWTMPDSNLIHSGALFFASLFQPSTAAQKQSGAVSGSPN